MIEKYSCIKEKVHPYKKFRTRDSIINLVISMIFSFFGSLACFSQGDSIKCVIYDTVVVTTYQEEQSVKSSLNIQAIDIDSMSLNGNYNLADLIAEEPGVEVLSSGTGISKPVIRGLSGNRVLILLSGLKFDNQQWQEEHGLGLSDFGLSTVEIIKGPMSVLYGSEAIGGVINLIEERRPKKSNSITELGMNFNSNTMGIESQLGYKVNKGNHWWRIRGGTESHADYSDGNNDRVLNSRFDGYYLKGSYGFKKGNWVSENNYMCTFNRFGFIFNDIYSFVSPDNHWSRQLNENPSQMVLLNVLSSQNKVFMKNGSKLDVNLGIQSNERMENEGSGAISLNMHLITGQYLVKWEKSLNETHHFILSSIGSYENNTNYGARKIVPDANMQEANISAYISSEPNKNWTIENGLGVGQKFIQTRLTPLLNDDSKEIDPFTKFSPYYNFLSGLSYHPNKQFNFKFNISSGVRVPNLAELSSDGLHEGIFTYEIGYPNLKNEQLFSANLLFTAGTNWITLSVSPFANYFKNYIYLSPTTEQWFGFPVYRYKQQDARQVGFEAGLALNFAKNLNIRTTYSGMESKTVDGDFTPYIPAQNIDTDITYSMKIKRSNLTLFSGVQYYYRQYHLAPNEIGTPDYFLLRAGVKSSIRLKRTEMDISVVGNNLLNTSYYSHLSRFKYLGLLNVGRSFSINFKIRFLKDKN